MEHLDFLIRDLALVLVVAGITTVIFKKIKQPLVLGYLLAGFLTSANFSILPSIVDAENIHLWGELGVIFIMFALGLEFSFHKIANIGGSAIVTASTVITAMVFIGYGTGMLLGWSRMDSIFLGGMLSMSSTMIILKAYDELKLKHKKYAQLVLGTLIIEDVVAIFMMIVLSTISVSKDVSGLELGGQIGKMLLYLIIWLLLGIYLIPTLLKRATKYLNDETLLIVSLGLCLGMVVIANYMGFSSALGAFLAGSILAGTVKAEKIEELVNPIKDFFGAVFFISVGMLVDPSLIVKYAGPILLLTIVTIVGQMTFSFIGVLLSGQTLRTAVGAGMSMVQIGEFSFIIASLGTSLGVTSEFLYPIVVSVSVITTFTTPMFIKKSDAVYAFLNKVLPKTTLKTIKQYTSDKQTENEKDLDWKEYLSKYIPRTVITTIILLCIYMAGTQVFVPALCNYGMNLKYSKWIGGALTVVLMTPVINMMSYRRNIIYTKLWLKNKTNRLPLLVFRSFRILVSLFFVLMTINTMMDIPVWILWILALIIVFFSVKSDFMASNSIKIETRFIANFNERILEKKKKERGIVKNYRWLDETLLIEQFEIQKILIDEPEKSIYARRKLGIQIIKVIRKDHHINLPDMKAGVREGDIIVVMGKKNNLDSYEMILNNTAVVTRVEEQFTLRDYTYRQIFTSTDKENHLLCMAVNVTNQCEFCNKTIQMSKIKEKYHGFVIGIDRGALSMVGPNKNTQIIEGDVLWVLGVETTVDKFLKEGILN
ncbi:cation:proton antiporter [Aminipila luticellarii]|uniref:Sodium:proton antiporter n=1 Tax=Aminipila luticellarii TaxID=2507160 RepID=A0A410PV35_9FIRM|nr:cation:proton antiporter [Aminipila luticellarii]QAT42716.1 sodium:proton antiporter [Aminipila luticellarii]